MFNDLAGADLSQFHLETLAFNYKKDSLGIIDQTPLLTIHDLNNPNQTVTIDERRPKGISPKEITLDVAEPD